MILKLLVRKFQEIETIELCLSSITAFQNQTNGSEVIIRYILS